MPQLYSNLPTARDSLELASLASSSPDSGASADRDDDDDDRSDGFSSRPSLSSSRRASLERDDPLDDHHPAAGGPRSRPETHARSFSVSSTFDFAANLFPLSSTTGAAGAGVGGYAPLSASASAAEFGGGGGGDGLLGGSSSRFGGAGTGSLEKHKTLTYLNGLSLIVGLIIGSGIFSSPSQVNSNAGSPGAALIVWTVAGVLAWTGAASYAELGGAIPLNGGSQVYLSKIFGELAGFLFTWVAVLVLKPGSAAIIAIIMGEYLVRAVIGPEAETVNVWVNKSVAVAGLALVTFLNCVSTRLGTRINDMLMFLKFVALLGVTVIGIVVAATGFSASGQPANRDWKDHAWFEGTHMDASAWAVALYAGLWAFDGWDNTNYVVGEFRNPGRDLPRVIHTAMPLVIAGYLLANIAYFLVLPLTTLNSTNTVAVMFGHRVFGPVGSLVLALIVSASCFGALNSSAFTSSRLVYVAGKEGYIPSIFGRLGRATGTNPSNNIHTLSSSRSGTTVARRFAKRLTALVGDDDHGLFFTPIPALLLNAALTTGYIVVGEFGTLVTFYGVAGYTFYFLTVLGLIVLRVREPNLERPYRTWITTPIIFCCVSLFLLSRAVFAQPLQTLIVVGFVVAGVPVFYWRVRGWGRGKGRGRGRIGVKAGFGGEKERPWWKFWKRR
ncbi:amino acid permease-domain-containing protein [Dichotomopilus funicola]|uniref:Amino acid permease-domain-containing protein n=1 Tax=Dichotomopilus funicola TaxID=1934379 RepID=A0AAN6VCW2_9PEZI|nr:amino acid permease-domain-containing protein [Dichotomopilus funicola]